MGSRPAARQFPWVGGGAGAAVRRMLVLLELWPCFYKDSEALVSPRLYAAAYGSSGVAYVPPAAWLVPCPHNRAPPWARAPVGRVDATYKRETGRALCVCCDSEPLTQPVCRRSLSYYVNNTQTGVSESESDSDAELQLRERTGSGWGGGGGGGGSGSGGGIGRRDGTGRLELSLDGDSEVAVGITVSFTPGQFFQG